MNFYLLYKKNIDEKWIRYRFPDQKILNFIAPMAHQKRRVPVFRGEEEKEVKNCILNDQKRKRVCNKIYNLFFLMTLQDMLVFV